MVVLPGQNRLRTACAQVMTAARKLITAYTCAFRVDFALPPIVQSKTCDSTDVLDCVSFRICALHRLEPGWNFDTYEVRADLLHGTTSVARNQLVFGTPNSRSAYYFPNRIVFDEVISFSSVAICTLPRESRLVLTVFGRRKLNDGETGGSEPERVELGWTAQSFFRFGEPHWTLVQGKLLSFNYLIFAFNNFENCIQGGRLLPLWPPTSDKRTGYVPTAGRHPRGHLTPLLSIDLIPELGDTEVRFPLVETPTSVELREFTALDDNTQSSLMDIVGSGSFAKLEPYQREVYFCFQNK